MYITTSCTRELSIPCGDVRFGRSHSPPQQQAPDSAAGERTWPITRGKAKTINQIPSQHDVQIYCLHRRAPYTEIIIMWTDSRGAAGALINDIMNTRCIMCTQQLHIKIITIKYHEIAWRQYNNGVYYIKYAFCHMAGIYLPSVIGPQGRRMVSDLHTYT